MTQGTIITFPTVSELNDILNGSRIDIVSPFYSGWALDKLTPARHSSVRLITRLPTTFLSPPTFLDNDPQPLKDAMSRLGDALSVYALPSVHAKLYVNDTAGWFGSANFTRNGFSGIGELVLRCSPPLDDLEGAFEEFMDESSPITHDNVQFLVQSVRSGLTRLRPKPAGGESSADIPTSDAVSYEDFGKWISRRRSEIATYLNQRMHNKYRMSGHAYSGFHGTFSFLTKNADIGLTLLGQRALPIPDDILDKLATFVRSHGAQFGGPRGGTWRSKLSTQLGGLQVGGGAGDVLVKRLLIEVPRYMRDKHLL